MLDSRIKLVTGDLTDQPDIDVIVNAANSQLAMGGGVCGAVFKAAGVDDLQAAVASHCPTIDQDGNRCPIGDAMLTPACNLPNKAIAHAVGPIYHEYTADRAMTLLGGAYSNTILKAAARRFKSIAVPAISCGIYGYPLEDAAFVALQTVNLTLQNPRCAGIEEVRFVFLPFADGPEVQAVFEAAYKLLNREEAEPNEALQEETVLHFLRSRFDLLPEELDILDVIESIMRESGDGCDDVDLFFPVGDEVNPQVQLKTTHDDFQVIVRDGAASVFLRIRWVGPRVRMLYSSTKAMSTRDRIQVIHDNIVKC